jgi:Cytochrome c554 and c-prime/Tetratricopeptide repeat
MKKKLQKGLLQKPQQKHRKKSLKKYELYGMAVLLCTAAVTIYFRYFQNHETSGQELYSLKPKERVIPVNKVSFSDFTGSESCKGCHQKEYDMWKNSTHAHAGGDPHNVNIIAKFNDKPLQFKDATVIPRITKQGDYIFDVLKGNKLLITIHVDAVVGGGYMFGGGGQSFFTKFPDGSLRCLPFEFISKEDIWYVALKNLKWVPITRDISMNDLENWLPYRFLGAVKTADNCQNCHGSEILVEKDPKKDLYTTMYKTLQINCESCHGPGKKHIELVTSKNFNGTDIGMKSLDTFSKDQSLAVCFQCHAIKDRLSDGYLPGDNFNNYFSTKLSLLDGNMFTPDGRVSQFAYQQNQLFSDCYVNGSMTCVDCHDPHSQKYRDIYGEPLSGRFDNGQCTDCHASMAKDPELHTKHKTGSAGNLCTSCHMPYLQHRVIGNKLTLTRSDHVIPIPRPEFDSSIGIENACQKCHTDKSIAELQKEENKMWGEIKPHSPIVSGIIRSAKVTEIDSAADLLLKPESNNSISQFMGMSLFMKRFLSPDMPDLSDNIINRLISLSKSKDIDVKSFALMCIQLTSGSLPKFNKYLYEQLNQAKGDELAIRLRWSDALYQIGYSYIVIKNYSDAVKVLHKALEIKPSSTDSWNMLGMAYIYAENYSQSIKAFDNSIKIDRFNTYAYFNISYAYRLAGDVSKSLQYIRTILSYDPDNAEANEILKKYSND